MARKVISEDEQSQLAIEEDTFGITVRDAEEQYTFAEETIAEYTKLGIVSRPRPRLETIHLRVFSRSKAGQYYDGQIPTNLVALTLDELSATYSLSSNWYGYLSAQFAMVSARRVQAKKKKEVLWSIIRNNYRKIGREHDVKYTDQKLSDFARQDKRFVAVDAEYEKWNCLYNSMYSLLEATKKEVETLSREVTIRQVKVESEARGRGMAGRSTSTDRRRSVDGPIANRTPAKVLSRKNTPTKRNKRAIRSPRGTK